MSLEIEIGDELPFSEVLTRIDAIKWQTENLEDAGDTILELAKLWRLKWTILVEGPKAATSQEIWDIFSELTRKSTDHSSLVDLCDPPAFVAFPALEEKPEKEKSTKKYHPVSLKEWLEKVYEETPREDAEALVLFLNEERLALDVVAERLFAGDRARAFTAGLFAGEKVAMEQATFYGEIYVWRLPGLSPTLPYSFPFSGLG